MSSIYRSHAIKFVVTSQLATSNPYSVNIDRLVYMYDFYDIMSLELLPVDLNYIY